MKISDAGRHLPLRPVEAAVLASLAERPRPGIDVLEAVNSTVPGHPIVGPGTLYRLLRELRQAGLIARAAAARGLSDERQHLHELTPVGRDVLAAEMARLERTLRLAERGRPVFRRG